MTKYITLILFVAATLFAAANLYAYPDRLIDGESAIVTPHLDLELKEDIIYTKGYINDWGMRSQILTGFFDWLEFSLRCSFNYFPDLSSPTDLYLSYYRNNGYDADNLDMDNPRLSFIEPCFKFKTLPMFLDAYLYTYVKCKIYTGIPVIVPYSEDGRDDNAIAVTTPNANQGQDITIALLSRMTLYSSEKNTFLLTYGTEAVFLANKNWMEENRQKYFMPVGVLSVQLISMDQWMVQVENRFEYWIGRGWHYEVLPGIRWEIQPWTIFEVGVGLPVLGGSVTRYFAGFSYKFGIDKIIEQEIFRPDSFFR
ncbi:MAG: hypothetical protein GY754_43905 [bacterium]|nr:hypothetical protein [bacterium]